ncbi:DEAD/DEAH box helicase [Flavobacterium sp. JP2137]|uniref:DEAD/DEAH box helicase n=1 Tax=Flavobacterium sp. JP2137 TaxID=3414510 RepID=UPI003D2FD457
MELQNLPFQDFPIEFKEINREDFFPNFDVGEKTIITPDENGYINEALQREIDIAEKNTVVINASVGQGKTYSIIEIVKTYFELEDYIVFIASPYVSLITQYYNALVSKDIPEQSIFRYEELGEEGTSDYLQKSIHIVTTNCLLGNPGEDALINSEVKRDYLSRLSKHCVDNQKKTIFIYDEIHDTIHNFKEKYVFNLWKWKDTICKNFVVSATFNEASKVVIEYMAELTGNKIQIIESQRKRFEDKQSDLYLYYNQARTYKYDDENITVLIQDLIDKDKEIDILTYSKKLAEDIIDNKDTGIGSVLYKKYTEINNCTSELVQNQRTSRIVPQNRYNPDKCNVGTNFKTGINIEKDNHAFVIIMPSQSCKMPFQNMYGIFSGGINTVTQALARQRKKGEIYIILPRPSEFDYTTLPFYSDIPKRDFFMENYDRIKNSQQVEPKVKYYPLSEQNVLQESFYNNEMKGAIVDEITQVGLAEREGLTRLVYPEYKLFKLDDGEGFLSNLQFFGGDLSAYITYSAIANQFVNCRLKRISLKAILFFEEGKVQQGLARYLEMYLTDIFNDLYMHLNDYYFYRQFRSDLFESYQLKIKDLSGKWGNIKPNGSSRLCKLFEQQLLGFVQRYLYANNSYNSINYYTEGRLVDGEYTRSQYLIECIAIAEGIEIVAEDLELQKKRILAYQFLGVFRDSMIASQQECRPRGGVANYLRNKPDAIFISRVNVQRFNETVDYLVEEDYFFSLGIYELKRRMRDKSELEKIDILYSILLKDLFTTKDYRLTSENREYVKIVLNVKEVGSNLEIINLISLPDYNFSEESEDLFFEIGLNDIGRMQV